MGDVIYDRHKFVRGWTGGLPETPCGYGSRLDQTEAQRRWIPEIVAKYGITSIGDIGAGDLNWIRQMRLPRGVTYAAYDLVPRHPDVSQIDIVRDVPRRFDLLMCLWVLNHLPPDACRAALGNLRVSGSRYLLMTDRPKWHAEQPPEIIMPHIAELVLRPESGDRMLLADLSAC